MASVAAAAFLEHNCHRHSLVRPAFGVRVDDHRRFGVFTARNLGRFVRQGRQVQGMANVCRILVEPRGDAVALGAAELEAWWIAFLSQSEVIRVILLEDSPCCGVRTCCLLLAHEV